MKENNLIVNINLFLISYDELQKKRLFSLWTTKSSWQDFIEKKINEILSQKPRLDKFD